MPVAYDCSIPLSPWSVTVLPGYQCALAPVIRETRSQMYQKVSWRWVKGRVLGNNSNGRGFFWMHCCPSNSMHVVLQNIHYCSKYVFMVIEWKLLIVRYNSNFPTHTLYIFEHGSSQKQLQYQVTK